MKLRALVLIVAGSLFSGCVYYQKVSLLSSQTTLLNPANVVVEDTRPAWERTTHIQVTPLCVRRYGDEFIVPSKVAYLRHLIASQTQANQVIRIILKKFDTLEYLQTTVDRQSITTAITSPSGYTYVTTINRKPAKEDGDFFHLHIVGEINGTPFDVSKKYDYAHLKVRGFPSEFPEYRAAISKLFEEAAVEILTTVSGQAEPFAKTS